MAHNLQVDNVPYAIAQTFLNNETHLDQPRSEEELDEKARLKASGVGVNEDALKSFDDEGTGEVKEVHRAFRAPTSHEFETLRRVPGHIPWQTYSICIVELAERFSYYGTTQVMTNYIQWPLPKGSKTGSNRAPGGQPGALNRGQPASSSLSLFNNFWSYCMPVLGGYVADTYWGRKKTIGVSIIITIAGRILIILSSIPGIIEKSNTALALFVVGLVVMGVGTGGFKSNISPLVAEQYDEPFHVKTLPSGENVIVDPYMTVSRVYMYFYLMINIGSIAGQVGMVFAEKYVGFWLSFTLPTALFLLCPLIMFLFGQQFKEPKPTGSVLTTAYHVIATCLKGQFSWNPVQFWRNVHQTGFWDKAKPSQWKDKVKPAWMTYDDVWVDEIRRGVLACNTFYFLPLYWLSYNQILNNLTSQAATLSRHGVPNDLLSNLDPIAVIILVPLFDQLIYPFLKRRKINFSPIKRLYTGFFVACCAMIWASVLQHYIYKTNPCGNHANSCVESELHSPINVWAQTGSYVLVATSEIFTVVTSLEYAFTKAPVNMRSLVLSINLLMNAFSAAIGMAFTALTTDPKLVINYMVAAILAFCAGTAFFFAFNKQDKMEDSLNKLTEISKDSIMQKATPASEDLKEKA